VGDFLMAIWANRDTCKPYTGPGRVGHVVRVTSSPNPTIINEFTDGGKFEHADCAPASLQSWFLDKTPVRTTIAEIERLAGTNINGTGWKGIEIAGLHFGYEIKFSPDNPMIGWIMNPGGGYIDSGSEFPSYLAATQGGCLVLPNVDAPLPKPKPIPSPPTEALPMFIVIGPGNVGIYFLYADGTLIPIGKPATVTSATAAGVKTIHLDPTDTETWAAMLKKTTRVNP
jgi:hypothetical protein